MIRSNEHWAAILAAALVWASPLRAAVAEEAAPRLTLEQALSLAAERREEVLLARETLTRARLARDRAWAAVLPTLTASGTYTHADREIAFSDRVLQRQDSVAGSVAARLPIVEGGSWAGLAVARHRIDAAEATAAHAERTLAFEVARAFFTAQAAENLVAAAERSLETAREHLQAQGARRRAGVVLATEEGRARLEVVEAEEALVRARNAREEALDVLALMTGLEPPCRVVPPADLDSPAGVEDAEVAVLDERADERAARAEVLAARSSLTEAWLDYLPTIAVTGIMRGTQNTGFSGDPFTWQILVTLDWVVFDGGLRRANRQERASEIRASRLRLEQVERDRRHELRRARRDLETARATLRTTLERRRLARETRDGVLRRYRGGVATSLELVEADDALTQSDLSLVARRLELILARLALLEAAGLDPLGREVGE